MKLGWTLVLLVFTSAVNAAPTPNKSVVCTFSTPAQSKVFINQKTPETLVNCSDVAMNSDLKDFTRGFKSKTKAELVEYLLSKGFEIKTDNIMVQKPKVQEKDEKVIKL